LSKCAADVIIILTVKVMETNMKKWLIILAVFFVLGFAAVSIPVALSFDAQRYDAERVMHEAALVQVGTMIAEYGDVKTEVVGANPMRVFWVTYMESGTRVFRKPVYVEEDAITVEVSDGARFIIGRDPSGADITYVLSYFDGRTRYFRLEKLNAHGWAMKAVQPDGFYNENILLED